MHIKRNAAYHKPILQYCKHDIAKLFGVNWLSSRLGATFWVGTSLRCPDICYL